jgi:hypothetical protein
VPNACVGGRGRCWRSEAFLRRRKRRQAVGGPRPGRLARRAAMPTCGPKRPPPMAPKVKVLAGGEFVTNTLGTGGASRPRGYSSFIGEGARVPRRA